MDPDVPSYPLRVAATLLGITPDALRKRVAAGKWTGSSRNDSLAGLVVEAEQVEAERAELLEKLIAHDARRGAAPGPEDAAELSDLRAQVVRLRATVEGLLLTIAGHQEAERGYLDALRQHLLPAKPPSTF